MIAVQLEGRMGNQLFQYAFIYAAAKKLNTTFYLDKSVEFFLLPAYFDLKNDFPRPLDEYVFAIQGYRNLFRLHMRKAFYAFLRAVSISSEIVVDNLMPPQEITSQLTNSTLYKGYFSSESFFESYKDEIRDLFQIKDIFKLAFSKVFQSIGSPQHLTVVHLRRGDYVALDIALPVSYYRRAIAAASLPQTKFVFISDDPAFVEKEFGYLQGKYVSLNSEIVDFQFLIQADTCILSGSSFSWWGAWLNTNPAKKIFAPEYWLGYKNRREYPAGVGNNLTVNWIAV